MKKPLIGTFLTVMLVSAILAAPSGAAKPTDAIICSPTGSSLSWASGTTSFSGDYYNASDQSVLSFTSNGRINGPGSTSLPTPPADALTVGATLIKKRGLPVRLVDTDCFA
jgi:hypothetical protein